MNTLKLDSDLQILDKLFSSKDELLEKRKAGALVIDLSNETSFDWEIPESFLDSYVSGPALAARIWAAFAGDKIDVQNSYESDNPIVITSSSLTNCTVPGGEVTAIAFRSPVSGSLCINSIPNTVGMRLAGFGYSALVMIGRMRRPAIVDIRKSGVGFDVSETFIGYTVSQMESMIGCGPMTTCMSIGPAGEQKVPFAAVICEGEVTGRGGLGCVFGFKNIKALAITGFDTAISYGKAHVEEVDKALEKLRGVLSESRFCASMQNSGSACLIKAAGKYGWAPVDNYSRRTDPRLFHISGDEICRRYGSDHSGCINCPVLCRHRTYDGIMIPGYEASLMLGSNLGCFEMDRIIERYAQCLDMGLDPVSTGNVLGWAKKASESGVADLLGEGFSFVDNSKVLPLIEMIAKRIGPGEPLSYGVYALGKAFENDTFAYSIRGLECGPYDYRGAYAQCVSDCLGFWFPNFFEIHTRLCKKEHVRWQILNERLVMGLESFGLSRSLIVPTVIEGHKYLDKECSIIPKTVINKLKPNLCAEVLSAMFGQTIQAKDILELGDRTWLLIYEINKALGFEMLSDYDGILPDHFSIDPESNHKDSSIVPIRELFDEYCFLRKQTVAEHFADFKDSTASES